VALRDLPDRLARTRRDLAAVKLKADAVGHKPGLSLGTTPGRALGSPTSWLGFKTGPAP
jgi:hypothetical protein